VGDKAGADRVVADVVGGRGDVLVVVHDPRREAVAPEVSPAAVPRVEALRVDAVQSLEREAEPLDGRVDEQVVVVRHQAEREDVEVEAVDALRQQREEGAEVSFVAERAAALDASGRDVEDAVGKLGAECAGHLRRP
jgi:hypothetical protein